MHFNFNSQTLTQTGKKKVLKVSMNTDSGYIKGSVYNVTDTTVTISRDFIAYNNNNISINDGRFKLFNYYNINSVTRVRKGSVLIGAVAGAAIGALIGLITYSKPQGFVLLDGPEWDAAAGGVLGTLAGTLVGGLIHKQKSHINKDRNRFQTFKLHVLSEVNGN